MHGHPVLAYNDRTRDGRALKISDFLTRNDFRRSAFYQEFYRPIGVEHMMGITLPTPPPLTIGIGLQRSGGDFTERERLLLNLLRPHLIQAYANARAVTRMRQQLARASRALEALDQGVITLTSDGRIGLATARARHLVAEYFPTRSRRPGGRLPEALQGWVRHQHASLAHPALRKPLVVKRDGKRLLVRHMSDAEQCVLLFGEQRTAPQPHAIEALGLTRREAEVLAWVSQGKTNTEIGIIISASPRTVEKHLERIFKKLGVETRTAAAAVAFEATEVTSSEDR